MHFQLLTYDEVDWRTLDQFDDRVVFQTCEWVTFVAESQKATPVLAALHDKNKIVGYFTGLLVSRMGCRILGSPFPGWTTAYMGFNLLPGVSRLEALLALRRFAFQTLRCVHLEVTDRLLAEERGEELGLARDPCYTYVTDLTQPESKILERMTSDCRRSIRKAERDGLRIEIAADQGFAADYYRQLVEVFAKQGLIPSYGPTRVESLIRHLLPTGRILLLRALDPRGRCIATGIYPALNKTAEFWGNASFREFQSFRPNELLHWSALRYWKAHGIEIFDWGGAGSQAGNYKAKYGGAPFSYSKFRASRFAFIGRLRQGAKRFFELKQRSLGELQGTIRGVRGSREYGLSIGRS
jgi:Acetyltransferase (GNAT) domain